LPVLATAFEARVAVVTVVAPADRAIADSAGTAVVYPEQANQCETTTC
jgi:hypothetical protein